MKNLYGEDIKDKPVEINIYADEIQSKECPYTKDKWFYIGIIAEDISNPLLTNIISERYCHNFDKQSLYYGKNDRIIHWSEITDIDTKNICKRWFEYILNPDKSGNKFYFYILGINDSKLNKDEFDQNDQFNSKYNRFFRSAIIYAIKTFFPNKMVVVKKVYHEEGQQQHDEYFPWHCIYKIATKEEYVVFEEDSIEFLSKDHRKDERSNIIQLCDAFMGGCTSIIHGIRKSKTSKYREELMDMIYPLVKRMIDKPNNSHSKYRHSNRIMIRLFPKQKTTPDDIKRLQNQFYTKRKLYYEDERSGQLNMF